MPYPHWCTAGQRADSLFSHSHTGSQHPHRLAIVLRALTAQQPASTQPHRASGAPDRGLPWLIRITHPRDAPSAFYAISHASSIHMHTRRPSPPPRFPKRAQMTGRSFPKMRRDEEQPAPRALQKGQRRVSGSNSSVGERVSFWGAMFVRLCTQKPHPRLSRGGEGGRAGVPCDGSTESV